MKCEYGCGLEAIHQFKNGKWCCENDYRKCPQFRKKVSNTMKEIIPWNKGKIDIYSSDTIEKMKDSHIGKNNYWYGKKLTDEHKNNISISHKGKKLTHNHKEKLQIALKGNKNAKGHYINSNINRLTIELIKKKYPIFSKIEEMRYNLKNLNDIQFHCKNHNCPNSKEKGGWFTPTYTQFYERVRCIERQGLDNSYFYCCDECKQECPLYKCNPNIYIKEIIVKDNYRMYDREEYNQFREYVLERDNYICQYCDEKAEHVHHERPQKLEPFFSLDPDFAWSVCKECHYKYGHKDECSTGNIAKINCKGI